jgi:hypothetical protein
MKKDKKQEKKKKKSWPPQHELKALARCLLPAIREFYETDEGRKAFAEWEREDNGHAVPVRQKKGNDG